MANEKRLIDGNGRYTLHASDNTDYSLLFRNGIICVENELGHCVCEFYADDAPTVDAVEVVHGRWVYDDEPDEDGNIQAHCNICGAGDKHATCMVGNVPYCWKCGAKMDGDCDGNA